MEIVKQGLDLMSIQLYGVSYDNLNKEQKKEVQRKFFENGVNK